MKSSIEDSHLSLLQAAAKILLELATFFVSDDRRAEKARRRLARRNDPEDVAFFAKLFEDLSKLIEVLQGVPASWGETAGLAVTRQLLARIRDDWLKTVQHHEDDTDDDSEEDESDGTTDEFAPLVLLLAQLNDPDDGPDDDYRISWLCERIEFEHTKAKSRRLLLEGVNQCYTRLKSLLGSQESDKSRPSGDTTTALWETSHFKDAIHLHEALSEDWDCTCFGEHHLHKKSIFSFETKVMNSTSTAGTMFFYTEKDGTYLWKRVQFQFEDDEDSLMVGRTKQSREQFCNVLENCSDGDLVKISAGITTLHRATRLKTPLTVDTTYSSTLPLSHSFELDDSHAIYRMKPKQRMILALYLVYAYLYLGGGDWWPYDRRSSVRLPNNIGSRQPCSPFFAASLTPADDKDKFSLVERNLNKQMPSLVALGKLLLELYQGYKIIWENLEAELDECEQNPFANEMVQVVKTCLTFRPTSIEPSTICDDKYAKELYIKDVVLPLQYILECGYKVKAHDLFAVPATLAATEMLTPVRTKSPTPIKAQGIEFVPSDFCLHDGDEQQKLDENQARSADSFMERLPQCNQFALETERCAGVSPIGIAILDTGADIPRKQLEHVYDGRLRECRTWLRSDHPSGEIYNTNLDEDGHGTHATAVLLEATQGTDIEIYVGQIFRSRSEKVSEQQSKASTSTRIANAIIYAVDVWKVKVISMSFGCPQPIDEVAEAIEYACHKNVLMIAAASNCGGNNVRSWPARDPRILCVHATDGHGNKYAQNPTPVRNRDNFATLGSAVNAAWPAGSDRSLFARKSGTSTATPVCAAIAGLIITVMSRSQEISTEPHMSADEYKRKISRLGRAAHMSNVLYLMVGQQGERDGYQYIAPWVLFDGKRSIKSVVEAILQAIDA